jgi:hypothetical protein
VKWSCAESLLSLVILPAIAAVHYTSRRDPLRCGGDEFLRPSPAAAVLFFFSTRLCGGFII